MDRTDDLLVAGAAAAGTIALVAVGEVASAGGPFTRGAPLSIYFLYAVVHDPDRGGLDRLRTWVGLAGLVTVVIGAWFLLA